MKVFIGLIFAVLFAALLPVSSFAAGSTGSALLEVLHNKGIVDDASYNEVKDAGAAGGDQAVNKKLIDVLYRKGVLDEASYKKLSDQAAAEAARPVAAAPAAQPVAAVAEAKPASDARPIDRQLTALEEGFARLSGDTVKLRIGAFIQAGWLDDDAGFSVQGPPTTGLSYTSGNQFFVRRARLFFDGQINSKIGFKISAETADTGGKVLRDAFVYFDYIPYTRVTAGQFKTPFGLETVEALGNNPAINRSFVSNFIPYPTLRDLGIMLAGNYKTKAAGLPLGAGYSVGLFNGSGMNAVDDNSWKDVVGHIWINPLVEGLTIGGSASTGRTHLAKNEQDHDRWGADIDYTPALVKGLKLRGEYMWERKYFSKYASKNIFNTTTPNTLGRKTHSYGWYALASYRVNGLTGPLKYINDFEPVFRYDYLDEDVAVTDNSRNRFTVGLNYYLNKYTRLMADYEIIHADGRLAKNSLEAIDLKGHHLFTTLVQVKF